MKIKELAMLIQGAVEGPGDTDVTGVSGLEEAKAGDLVFATDEGKLAIAEKTAASCILTSKKGRKSSKPLVRVDNPKLAFLLIYNFINKPAARKAFIDPSATVASSAKIGGNVWIGAGVRIDDDVRIGNNTIIEANTVISKGASIGSLCHIYPNVTLYGSVVLKDKVALHAGVVLGADGFGYVRDKDKLYKFPQLGRVIVEENVEIGANTTIDRGSLSDTVIGAGTKIDNLCQIAHNVKIGRNVVMAGQCGVSGSVTIKDNVTMGGQVGVKDNVTINSNVMIGGQTGVLDDLPEGSVVWGMPARPLMYVKRQIIMLSWLTNNFAMIKKLLAGKDPGAGKPRKERETKEGRV